MSLTFRTKTKEGWTVDSVLTPFTFPAGEAHIKGAERLQPAVYQLADLRGYDSHELFQLAMWGNVNWATGAKRVLLLPYLPGARADRGEPFGAQVYADFLNRIGFDQVITLDPHSPVMPGLIENLTVFPFQRIIKRELGDRGDMYNHPYVGVIAPDKGAIDRAQRVATALHVPLFKAEKTRDFETGQLTGFTCETLPDTGKLLIVDDICDGGGTFIGLAKELKIDRERLDLWVTHGVFSKGFSDLLDYIGHIHTTDSYDNGLYIPSRVTVHPVLPYLTGEINLND